MHFEEDPFILCLSIWIEWCLLNGPTWTICNNNSPYARGGESLAHRPILVHQGSPVWPMRPFLLQSCQRLNHLMPMCDIRYWLGRQVSVLLGVGLQALAESKMNETLHQRVLYCWMLLCQCVTPWCQMIDVWVAPLTCHCWPTEWWETKIWSAW